MTLLSENSFEVAARVPEIDIRNIHLNDPVTLSFDAAPREEQRGVVSFVSPLATQVDGVGYFDTTIELTSTSSWMREGLNADVTIHTNTKDDAVRLPKRFIVTKDNQSFVHIPQAGTPPFENRKIDTGLSGTNGFVEVTLPLGTTVIAP
jgi:multidrug efflux pump subunit AcrA (membrane-fusion protein)